MTRPSAFADDVLALGVAGLSAREMQEYLEYVADRRLVQERSNFFERRVSAYPVGITGDVVFNEEV